MSNYLISWYGISDLSASLGVIATQGPLLAALQTGDYDKAIILAYLNDNKELLSPEDFSKISHNPHYLYESCNTVHSIANTQQTNTHYFNWLQAQLAQKRVKVELEFRQIHLDYLNDSDNIYMAALDALSTAAKDADSVTFNLSPGTPCMAFNWALVALRYPRLDIRLVTTSQPSKPPEIIHLPNAYTLEFNHTHTTVDTKFNNSYDVIFHIFGDQRLPHYRALQELEAKEHIYVYTSDYPPDIMKRYVDRKHARFSKLEVQPYDPLDVQEKILARALELPGNYKIAVNITGGTKLMSAGATSASKKINADTIYFNLADNKVINMEAGAAKTLTPLDNVLDLIGLNADDKNQYITNNGSWGNLKAREFQGQERREITYALFKHREKLQKLYKDLNKFSDEDNINNFELPVENPQNDEFSISHYTNDKGQLTGELRINGHHYGPVPQWANFGQYLSGGWFEEYIYQELKPLENSGLIHDLRINITIGYKRKVANEKSILKSKESDYNELDICFTDGEQLWIVSCKSGITLETKYIDELESDRQNYGGLGAIGIIASCFDTTNPTFLEKVKNTNRLHFVTGNNIGQKIKKIILANKKAK